MHLTKHHGLGNDFLVALVDEVPPDAPALAVAWCNRTRGVGADGLIFGTPADTRDADLRMTLFNSDGSRAEISGNGIRCLAQAALSRAGGSQLRIVTDGGVRMLGLIESAGSRAQISVEMGAVGAGPELPEPGVLARPGFSILRAATADVGNPHVVLEVDVLESVDPALDGPAIEDLWKPDGINVHFLTHTGDNRIRLVHWERGAGATEACGSGATVSATVAHGWGLVGTDVSVEMPGGDARVQVGDEAVLIGPAVHIADIEVAHG